MYPRSVDVAKARSTLHTSACSQLHRQPKTTHKKRQINQFQLLSISSDKARVLNNNSYSFTRASQVCLGRTHFIRHILYPETKTQKHTSPSTMWQLVLFPVITATLHLSAPPVLSPGHIKQAFRPPSRCQPAALTGYLLCNTTT